MVLWLCGLPEANGNVYMFTRIYATTSFRFVLFCVDCKRYHLVEFLAHSDLLRRWLTLAFIICCSSGCSSFSEDGPFGLQDAFVVNNDGINQSYINDGFGSFTPRSAPGVPYLFGFGKTSQGVSLGDLDGDGDLDAFVANAGQSNSLYVNNGSGGFTPKNIPVPMPLTVGDSQGVSLGDFNGDGYLDAFVVNNGQLNRLYVNDGSRGFTPKNIPVPMPLTARAGRGVSLGDFNGDGKLDAFVVNFAQANRLYLNDGSSGGVFRGFTVRNIGPMSGTSLGVSLGDLDGDGDLDAFVVNSFQANRLYINDGSGNFTDRALPTSPTSPGGRISYGVSLGDFNGDGKLDAFVVNGGNGLSISNHDALYINDGSGGFALSDISVPGNTRDGQGVSLGDFNGDGKLDAFVMNSGSRAAGKDFICLNKGTDSNGSFDGSNFDISDAPGNGEDSRGVSLGDLDGDGDLDAFMVGNGQINRVYVNNGLRSGKFITVAHNLLGDSRGVSLGDLDGDGDVDAFVVNGFTPAIPMRPNVTPQPRRNQPNLLYVKDAPSGGFAVSVIIPPPTVAPAPVRQSQGVSLGDVDGDGYLDAFVVNDGQLNRLYVNDGSGSFTASDILVPAGGAVGNSQGVALGDFNGDGYLDAFVVNGTPTPTPTMSSPSPQPNRLYVNDGSGGFTASDISVPSGAMAGRSLGVSLGDLDGDGDLDAFVVNDGQLNRLYVNDGSGSFTVSDAPGSARDSLGVSLGDLDGDGDLDAFVVNDGQLNRLYVNDGSGSFTVSDAPGSARDSLGVSLGDLDGDGDLDAFVVNDGQSNRLYVNDGSGSFTLRDIGPPMLGNSWGVSLGAL